MYYKRNRKNRHDLMLLMERMDGQRVVAFDMETTGLDPEADRIIDLALIVCRVRNRMLIEEERWQGYIRPSVPVSEKASAVNGLTDAFLSDKPTENELWPEILRLFGSRPILLGHNVGFDIGMLKAAYRRHGLSFPYTVALDTMEFARDNLTPDVLRKHAKANGQSDDGLYRLSSLAAYYGVDEGLNAHSALDDVEATVRLTNVMYSEYASHDYPEGLSVPMKYFYFWEGRNKEQQGIWVRLEDDRLIFYSTLYKTWCSGKVDLAGVNVSMIEDEILRRCNITLAELGKLTPRRWEQLKEKRRQEGVHI